METASQLALPNSKHANNGLFSDYYLNDIVPTTMEALNPLLYADAQKLRDELRDLLAQIQPENLDEAQLEERWVKPVLAKLGHHWSVQVKIRYRDRGFRKPDYVFTKSAAEANALTNAIYSAQELQGTVALGDAKRWGAKLDQTSGQERNPSQQIDEYLRYSELPWGILTDGQHWRLYHRDSSKDNLFYAVDLPGLLAERENDHEAVTNFLSYFYLFFRLEAFAAEGWLERVLQGSIDYAASLSDTLEDEVYEALELIAQGFLDFRRNRLTPNVDNLRTVYEQSLVLLYRLLFILYAESRDVLPMNTNRAYAEERSLHAINMQVGDMLKKQTALSRKVDQDSLYHSLSALFFAIDSGSPEYEVTPYNGRLFSEKAYPFLVEKSVGDAYLAPALDKLARVNAKVRSETRPRRVFVDYRDLDVRHLGAIYEKLLEYQLDVAAEPLAIRGSKYVPAQTGDKIAKEKGHVYLRTGNFERKITGSFYTPDYIVRFIVERTLEPLLTEITERYAVLDDEEHWQVRDHDGLRRAILSVDVLDPATGSGHFMVEAVAFIAEWLRRLALQPDDLAPDEDELVYWKRQVVTSCIYGVDINPLAVELAKLSLWLATLARGKPLSFLDHHVKLGNTLVGARMSEIGAALDAPPDDAQPPLFEEALFSGALGDGVRRIMRIETTVAGNVQDVKGHEQSYATYKDKTEALRALADVWTARRFGLEVTPEAWADLYTQALSSDGIDGDNPLVQEAAQLRRKYAFFPWDLEFPEVFFGEDGKPLADAGFDAVIGNPPYVRQERLQPYKPYFQAQYQTYQGTADLYVYFYERGLSLVKKGHRVGYITSGTFMNSNSAAEFRRFLHGNAAFEYAVNFGENQPFKGAEMVYPTISIIKREKPAATFQTLFVEGTYRSDRLKSVFTDVPFVETSSTITALEEWRFQSIELTSLFRKVAGGKQILRDVVQGRLYSGIKTGLSEAFVIDAPTRMKLIAEHPSSEALIRPFLLGQDFRPWYHIANSSYLIAVTTGTDIDRFPAIRRHLENHRKALAQRSEAESGTCLWYELRPCSYYDEFAMPKIIWPDIGKLPRFSWDSDGLYHNDKGFFVISSSFSSLAVLNSRVTWFMLSQIATPLRLRAGLWQYQSKIQFVERLPIPELTPSQDSSLAEIAKHITKLARERYQLHEGVRHRIRDDLGSGGKLNQALESWWKLEFQTLRTEIKKAFKSDVPLAGRDDWEKYLASERAKHQALTDQIIAQEIRLNAIVYEAFNLTPEEIDLIEKSTKYPYGAV